MRPGAAPLMSEPIMAQSSPVSGILIASQTLTASGGTPSATLGRQLSRWLNAGMTPAATLGRNMTRVLVAAMTPAATLTQQTRVYLRAVVIAPVATLAPRAQLVLRAALTPVATMSRNIYVTLAAAVPMAGTLARVVAAIKRYRATDESRSVVSSRDKSEGDSL